MDRKLLLLAAAAALLPGCQKAGQSNAPAAAEVNVAADEQTIRSLNERWLQLIKAKDAAAIAQLYAEDGVVMPPNQPIGSGREAIQKFWQSTLDIPEMTLTFEPERIHVSQSGDVVIDRGTYRFTGKPGGQAIDETGKYVVVWKKVGSDWKVANDIFNSDKPAAGG